MQVHLGGAMAVIHPQSPGHLGQGTQNGTIDGGQASQGLGLMTPLQRQGFVRQFANDFPQRCSGKDAGGFAQRTEGNMAQAQEFLDFVHVAALLQAAEAGEDGVKEVEQEQPDVLIEKEPTVASLVACRTLVFEAFHQGQDQFEVFQALEIFVGDRRACI